MTYNRDILISELERDEGKPLFAYDDKTGKTIEPGTLVGGWVSIGTGRNLVGRGITEDERLYLLGHDIDNGEATLDQYIPWWRGLSDARQRALLNLSFMGWGGNGHGFSSLTKFLGLMQSGDYEGAANDLLGTAYAREVGQRANRIATLIRQG